MKKTYFLIFLSYTLLSCSDDNEVSMASGETEMSKNSVNKDLLGDWTLDTLNIEATTNTSNVLTVTEMTGVNLNYKLSFDESNYNISGSYDLNSNILINNQQLSFANESITDVEGVGGYRSTETNIISEGSFFALQVQGVDVTKSAPQQTSNYEIHDNRQLIISQLLNIDTIVSEVAINILVDSRSVWSKID